MATFSTADPGRTWTIRLTVGLCERIKAECGIDIAAAVTDSEKFIGVLFTEPAKLVSALYLACEKQVERERITPEQFGELFDADVLDESVRALLEAIVDFFPKARGRDAIKRGLPRVLSKMQTDVEAEIDKRLSTLSEPAGSTPA